MDIQLNSDLAKLNNHSTRRKQKKAATSFEELFTRQLVKEMTKGLFKHDDNNILGAGSDINRDHIVTTLSRELAEQHKLGIADMVTDYFNQRTNNHQDES